jgi:hypothetical protein
MRMNEIRVIEEYELASNFFAYVRTLHESGSVRVDLSLLKKWENDRDELHVYSYTSSEKIPADAIVEIYKIISDVKYCQKLWQEGKTYKQRMEDVK